MEFSVLAAAEIGQQPRKNANACLPESCGAGSEEEASTRVSENWELGTSFKPASPVLCPRYQALH